MKFLFDRSRALALPLGDQSFLTQCSIFRFAEVHGSSDSGGAVFGIYYNDALRNLQENCLVRLHLN